MEKFKILQLTDTHLDKKNLGAGILQIKKLVEYSRPDLTVFTGDISTDKTLKATFAEINGIFEELSTDFAFVLGNHDSEYSRLTREEIVTYVSSLSRCVSYDIPIGARRGNCVLKTPFEGIVLALIDSGDYIGWRDKLRCFPCRSNYAYITAEQIEWYKGAVKEERAVFAFFHMPLPEYWTAYYGTDCSGYKPNSDCGGVESKKGKLIYGKIRENLMPDGSIRRGTRAVCSPQYNSGFFEAATRLGNLKAVFVGHDHVNDCRVSYKGVDLVFGQKTVQNSSYNYHSKGFEDASGGTLLTVKEDGSYDIEQVIYKDIKTREEV